MRRSRPLVRVSTIFDHQWSHYPDRIKVPMDDGRVIEYQITINLPEPVIGNWLKRFEEKYLFGGYKYKRKNYRKRRGDENNVNGETGEHSVQTE